jgi:hypothetical protein
VGRSFIQTTSDGCLSTFEADKLVVASMEQLVVIARSSLGFPRGQCSRLTSEMPLPPTALRQRTLECLDDETVTAGVLICSDSQWALNALKETGHSAHSILSPLRAHLRGIKGRVCFQWDAAHCSLLGNKRADEEARKAADLGPADDAQRGRITFEVVKRLNRSQVKDGLPNHAHTLRMYGDGPFRPLQGASRREEVLLA